GGSGLMNQFGAGYIQPNQCNTVYFDKNIAGKTDGAGNPVPGVWMCDATPNDLGPHGFAGGVPLEVCVALVNEVNALAATQGITTITHMWLNVPMWGMCSTDPDYSSSSNWTTNALDVIMNPASSLRVAGYSALGYSGSTQVNAPSLIAEHGNEEWNGGNDNKSWAISAGFARYGLPFLPTSSGNEIDICALRAVCGARDAKATGASYLSRVKFVLGMWATFGLATTGGMDGAGNK